MQNKSLTLAFSPCPNDTFAFHAMINGLVDTEDLIFKIEMADVEELNQRAAQGKYDICKLSYHAFFALTQQYIMLRSGSALGFNNGPLLIKRAGESHSLSEHPLIAIPGKHTTAALLLKTAYPEYTRLKPMLFSEIEKAVLENQVDAGVLIHEGRFTYRNKGMELICDLGDFWQSSFGYPIPLGGIALKKELQNGELEQRINRVLQRSILYARNYPNESQLFITENARELSQQVQHAHIQLFVNDFTIDIGTEGEKAVNFMYQKYLQLGNAKNCLGNENFQLFINKF